MKVVLTSKLQAIQDVLFNYTFALDLIKIFIGLFYGQDL